VVEPQRKQRPKNVREEMRDWIEATPGMSLASVTLGIIAFIVVVITIWFIRPLPPNEFTISTGPSDGFYYRLAQTYREELIDDGFTLRIRPGAGAAETLERLRNGETDIGLVQGGLADVETDADLRSLGSIGYEPVWVFHDGELPIERLANLQGRRVSIGEIGSGTHPVALALLELNEVTPTNTFLRELPDNDAADALIAGEIDAAFFVTAPETPVIERLMNASNLTLLDFQRANAYQRHFSFIKVLELTEGAYDLRYNLPKQNVTLIGTTATIVVNREVHPDIVRLLLRTAVNVHAEPGLLHDQNEFPSEEFIDLPLHQIAQNYLRNGPSWFERTFPFRWAGIVERLILLLIPLVTVVYPLLRGVPPLYTLGIRVRMTRWYRELKHIDEEMDDYTVAEIEEALVHLREIMHTVTEQLSLPSFFMGNLYTLKIHIRVLRSQLEERRTRVLQELMST